MSSKEVTELSSVDSTAIIELEDMNTISWSTGRICIHHNYKVGGNVVGVDQGREFFPPSDSVIGRRSAMRCMGSQKPKVNERGLDMDKQVPG